MSDTPSHQTRLHHLDAIKTLAMLMVCCYHFPAAGDVSWASNMSASTLIRRFFRCPLGMCIPLFMMVNGALLLNRPLSYRKHMRRTVTLVIQFVVWRAITIVGLSYQEGVNLFADGRSAFINRMLFFDNVPGIKMQHLWFMPMLVAVYILFPALKALFDAAETDKESRGGLAFFLGTITLLCTVFAEYNLLKGVNPSLSHLNVANVSTLSPLSRLLGAMVVYFCLGGLAHRHRDELQKIPAAKLVAVFVAGWLLIYAEWLIRNHDTGGKYDATFGTYHSVAGFLMTLPIYLLLMRSERLLQKSSLVTSYIGFIGSNTLGIYYLHWILATCVRRPGHNYVMHWAYHAPQNLANDLLKGIYLMTLSAIVCAALKRIPGIRRLLA